MKKLTTFFIPLLLLPSLGIAGDADWPQWRGPNRDGHAASQSLLQSWPDGGPQVSWSVDGLGTGYSSASIADEHVFTIGSKNDMCTVFCLSVADGSLLWETIVGRAAAGVDYNTRWGAGPRSSPTIDGDQVFMLSDVGTVAALNRSTGEIQWTVDLVADHEGSIPNWGYSESPLVDGDRVIVTPGGVNFMIGLDRKTGRKVWSSKDVDAPAQYASVIKGTVGATTFYVTASKPGLFLFDAASGENLLADTTTANGVAVVPTPIFDGDFLYHTSAYGAGNTLLKLGGPDGEFSAQPVYALNIKTMENHHGGVVLVDGVIYGFTKQSGGNWMAQDLESGETLWLERVRPNKSGSICFADGRLYCYNDKEGTVILVEPSRDGWKPTGELELPEQTKLSRKDGAIWTHPVVANGKLIVRDQDLMHAFDIAR